MTRHAKKTTPFVLKQHRPQGVVATVRCQWCGKNARVIPFGYGYIAACCGHILYSNRNLPDREPDKAGTVKE